MTSYTSFIFLAKIMQGIRWQIHSVNVVILTLLWHTVALLQDIQSTILSPSHMHTPPPPPPLLPFLRGLQTQSAFKVKMCSQVITVSEFDHKSHIFSLKNHGCWQWESTCWHRSYISPDEWLWRPNRRHEMTKCLISALDRSLYQGKVCSHSFLLHGECIYLR